MENRKGREAKRVIMIKVSEVTHARATELAKFYETTLSGLFEWECEQSCLELARVASMSRKVKTDGKPVVIF